MTVFIFLAQLFLTFIGAPGGALVGGNLPPWLLLSNSGGRAISSAMAGILPIADLSNEGWRLVLEIILVVIALIGFFRPQPPLHQQYASKEEVEKHKKEIWEVINGLRGSVSHIKNAVGEIKTLREANGERLDEVSRELLELIKQVATLNERTARHHSETHGHS